MNPPTHRPIRLLFALASLALATPSHAALLALDLDPGTLGIQDTIDAAPGQTFAAELIFFPDAAGVSGWKFSVNFDTTELSLLGNPASTTATPPVGFFGGSIDLVDTSLGRVWGYFAQAITPGSGPTSGSIPIGTIHFTVTIPVTDGLADLTPGFFNPGSDGALDNLGNALTPTFQPAYVNVVPEPASAALLGLSLPALLSVRRLRGRRAWQPVENASR